MNHFLTLTAAGVTGLLLVSCQGTDRRAVAMNYSDAVTNINQVDPAYRPYFRSQQGAGYSVEEQRAALAKTVQTMRTPVPTSAPVSQQRLATRSVNTRRGTASAPRKAAKTRMAKNTKSAKSSAKKKALAVNTPKKRRKG